MGTRDLFSGTFFERYLQSKRWWLVILAIPVLFALWLVVSILILSTARYAPLKVSGFATTYFGGILILASYAAALLSLIAVYYDRRYVRSHSAWNPSGLYYLMVIPLLNVPIACLYLFYRHRYVGIP
ncbi:hypothetical protein [Haladaptatus salinisoli]|uniref:hypothetical protein n=1 Tax=Haladaptatus salinisoli TaxID=2884876 RepID=UPI001D0BAD58|nr:hypothetical protein [Haladaptatus salinisoli]